MGHAARGDIWIPIQDWYDFVTKYAPHTTGEMSFGPPSEMDGELSVPFAINTECHPMDEASPPECIKGKKTSNDGSNK
jgi:hypothetical protein